MRLTRITSHCSQTIYINFVRRTLELYYKYLNLLNTKYLIKVFKCYLNTEFYISI